MITGKDITVVIPTIPTREALLSRALASVKAQTMQPALLVVEHDTHKEGPAVVRNRALERVETEYVAFLDDDDEMRPFHLEALAKCADGTDADLVYPWFDVVASDRPAFDPLGRFGLPFDAEHLDSANYIPVTVLARARVMRDAGGFVNRREDLATCEDWGCWLRMRDAGARFVHLPRRTWLWHWHAGNTSGLTSRW